MRRKALQMTGIALVAMEKVAQRIYELKVRPAEYQYEPWLERVNAQLLAAIDAMEVSVGKLDHEWLFGQQMTQADISIAVAWRFINFRGALDCRRRGAACTYRIQPPRRAVARVHRNTSLGTAQTKPARATNHNLEISTDAGQPESRTSVV